MALPGIDLPLKQSSDLPTEGIDGDWRSIAKPITVRERVMMDLMAVLKDKSGWEEKVFDQVVVEKWKSEAISAGDSMRARDEAISSERQDTDGPVDRLAPSSRQRVISEAVFDYCIEELRFQVPRSKQEGFTEVLDANAAVYVSDTAISLDTKQALQTSVAPLENVPDQLKDWHPGSDGKVLDLVHPSLFPLMYGISRFLRDSAVPLKECANYSGKGEVVPSVADTRNYSSKHQWLPCEVSLDTEGNASITSYINNLHPAGNELLYASIERVITKSVPMWKQALRSTLFHYEKPRIEMLYDGYDTEAAEWAAEEQEERRHARKREKKKLRKEQRRRERDARSEDCQADDDSDDDDDDDDDDAVDYDDDDRSDYDVSCYDDKWIEIPEPDTFAPRERPSTKVDAGKVEQRFATKGLQVIVKLSSIHLTTDKPSYDGGSWHIEGLPNEHIVSSSLYYYDCENVTDSHLAFRETVDAESLDNSYEQHQHRGLEEIFGLSGGSGDNSFDGLQVLGQVLTREDRLLVFPNVLQHCVQPFRLADETRPGHRKILALFLVDPSIRIPSTANIPPQQLAWWAREVNEEGLLGDLPPEITDRVYDEVGEPPLSLKRAKQVRAELMEERGAHRDKSEAEWHDGGYNFCEH